MKMLFVLLLIFEIFYSASCSMSCYQAPFDTNKFDYIVTSEHFPMKLDNYTLVTNSTTCYLQVLWQRNPNQTNIGLVAGTINEQSLTLEHKLQALVGYQRIGSAPMWYKQIIYQCATNECNSLNQLKQLLTSLTVNESLSSLTYLLDPVKPFHAEWCYRGSNVSMDQCNTSTPISQCQRCDLIETMDEHGLGICGKCSTEDPDNSLLLYEKTFNMTSRTETSSWGILCARQNCNRPAIGSAIQQKTLISFNYSAFIK